MRGVADDHAAIAVVVRAAFDVDERLMLVAKELRLQRLGRDEVRGHAGEVVLEKFYDTGRVGFKFSEDSLRGEKLAGKGAVLLGLLV